MFSDEHFNLPTISTQFSYIDFSFTASGVGVKLRKLCLWRGIKPRKLSRYFIYLYTFSLWPLRKAAKLCLWRGIKPRKLSRYFIYLYTFSLWRLRKAA